jgi:hypothetical protein
MSTEAVMNVGPSDDVAPADADQHVVLTLPPLAQVLPAAWQHYVRHRLRHPYDTWLEAVLSTPPRDWPTVVSFWHRHHYDALVGRWVSVVGVERLLVCIGDAPEPSSERSLTAAEAELVRLINVAFHHRKWPPQRYDHVVRRGVLRELQRHSPSPDEPHIVTPGWAIDRANEIAAADAARIATSGVRVQGDLATLSNVSTDADEVPAAAVRLTLDAAVDAVVGAVSAVSERRSR